MFLQKRRNKKVAICFLSRLLNVNPKPGMIVADKLRGYTKPIRHMGKVVEHRSHKELNNRVENAHQPARRKEKCPIRFKSPAGAQKLIADGTPGISSQSPWADTPNRPTTKKSISIGQRHLEGRCYGAALRLKFDMSTFFAKSKFNLTAPYRGTANAPIHLDNCY